MTREQFQQLCGEHSLPDTLTDILLAAYDDQEQAHARLLAQVRFDGALEAAIARSGGRNAKAIAALLDTQSLQASNDPQALDKALTQLKKENDYLFRQPQTPPPYAPGTGTAAFEPPAPTTLAGALRERFGRN